MVEEQIEGLAREGLGHVEDGVGGFVGDTGLQARGKLDQATGAIQRTWGEVQDQAERLAGEARGMTLDAYDEVDAFVRREPWICIAVAAGVGLLAGLALRPPRTVYRRLW
ncbi:MAG TPA: hypothetical protein VGM25_03415 [Caulobacteraceae bacterium]|jgi:ElaB/YqjD/DUF883 family membrane-anchored ribosome-binding protein